MPKTIEKKIALVKAFMQVEGDLFINGTWSNHYNQHYVEFAGVKSNKDPIKITMDIHQIEAIDQHKSVSEIYDCYKEMQYF